MRVSYSALVTYKTCPLKYKYQEIDKVRTPKSKEAVFGTAIHEVLKFMFKRSPLYPSLDEVVNHFTDLWKERKEKVEWQNPEDVGVFYEDGVNIIKKFYAKNQPWNFNIVDLESRFAVPLPDPKNDEDHALTGIMDRIDKPAEGLYEIIDYKTARRLPSQNDLDQDLQMSIYHLGLVGRWPHLETQDIKLSLYFLKHNEKISTVRNVASLNKTKETILEIIHGIEKDTRDNNFVPITGPLCDWCGYRKVCPMWSHEYKKEEVVTKSEEEIAEAIKEFFQIKTEEVENKKRLIRLRADILNYMEKNNLGRVFGSPGFITKNTQERETYDMPRVREVLEPTGDWQKILEADQKRLIAILPSLSKETQQKLKEFITKKSFVVLKHTKK